MEREQPGAVEGGVTMARADGAVIMARADCGVTARAGTGGSSRWHRIVLARRFSGLTIATGGSASDMSSANEASFIRGKTSSSSASSCAARLSLCEGLRPSESNRCRRL
eukprot:5594042-Prymnesium_polylepis.1